MEHRSKILNYYVSNPISKEASIKEFVASIKNAEKFKKLVKTTPELAY